VNGEGIIMRKQKIVVQTKKSKKIIVQVEKSSKWKGLRTIFNPYTSYQVLKFVEEEIEVMVVQMTNFLKNVSPSENTQQSTKT
jgi:hypothetical protein